MIEDIHYSNYTDKKYFLKNLSPLRGLLLYSLDNPLDVKIRKEMMHIVGKTMYVFRELVSIYVDECHDPILSKKNHLLHEIYSNDIVLKYLDLKVFLEEKIIKDIKFGILRKLAYFFLADDCHSDSSCISVSSCEFPASDSVFRYFYNMVMAIQNKGWFYKETLPGTEDQVTDLMLYALKNNKTEEFLFMLGKYNDKVSSSKNTSAKLKLEKAKLQFLHAFKNYLGENSKELENHIRFVVSKKNKILKALKRPHMAYEKNIVQSIFGEITGLLSFRGETSVKADKLFQCIKALNKTLIRTVKCDDHCLNLARKSMAEILLPSQLQGRYGVSSTLGNDLANCVYKSFYFTFFLPKKNQSADSLAVDRSVVKPSAPDPKYSMCIYESGGASCSAAGSSCGAAAGGAV
jgi:hypothetical protein